MVRWSQLFVVPYPRSISLTGLFSVLRGVLTLHFFINLSFRSMTHHIAQGNDSSHCTGQWLITLHSAMTHHIAQGNDSSQLSLSFMIWLFFLLGKDGSYDLLGTNTDIRSPSTSKLQHKDHQTIRLLPTWSMSVSRGSFCKHAPSFWSYSQLPYMDQTGTRIKFVDHTTRTRC